MTDKHLTSQPSSAVSAKLDASLTVLRSHGVASASFSDSGQLLQVTFFAATPELPVDEPAEQIIKGAVDGALASLATRGQRKERASE